MTDPSRRERLNRLLASKGKFELIGRRIVEFPMPGYRSAVTHSNIGSSLRDYAAATGRGEAYYSNLDYAVPEMRSGRESFRPDASYYDGPSPEDPDDAIPGPPTLAVEVRSKGDYGPAAELEMAAKRADYFEAGTLVVWDVDPVECRVSVYRRDRPDRPTVFRPGEIADAEPAVPGWRMAVDDVFA